MKKDSNPERIKIIVDTNIFVSALLGSKNCQEIYDLFELDKFDILISPLLLEEYKRITVHEKFVKIIDKAYSEKLLNLIEQDAQKVSPTEEISICRDTKDNIVLECAIAGDADFIVTGDKDLLSLKKFKGISIITPKEFIKLLK